MLESELDIYVGLEAIGCTCRVSWIKYSDMWVRKGWPSAKLRRGRNDSNGVIAECCSLQTLHSFAAFKPQSSP